MPLRTLSTKAQPLVVEAGTGTGKTYAYTSLLRCGRKEVIISTGSKAPGSALQPRFTHGGESAEIQRASGLAERRSNYLCLERLEQQALAGGDLPVQTLSDVIVLRARANQTEEGDQHLRERAGRLPGTAAGDQHQ